MSRPLSLRIAKRTSQLRNEVFLVVLDALAVALSAVAALVLRFDGAVPAQQWDHLLAYLPVAVALGACLNTATGLYGQIWRHASVLEARRLVTSGAALLCTLLLVDLSIGLHVPLSVLVLGTMMGLGVQGLMRFQTRLFAFRRRSREAVGAPVLVLGAGSAGAALVRDMLEHPQAGLVPVGLLDDDPTTHGYDVHGVPVLGGFDTLPEHAEELHVLQVVLTVRSPDPALLSRVSGLAERAEVALRILGGEDALSPTVRDVRDVRIEDLLGREQVDIDMNAIERLLSGRRVLVTGAGGSIGSELARQVAACDPALLVLLDHDETHLHDAVATIPSPVRTALCDIRQAGVLQRVLATHLPEVVFHAAAHKHVPLLEDHPTEAVQTNVEGTQNLVDACVDAGVERLVFISTDKAVHPTSVMGASKAIGEQLVLRAAADGHRFSAVRFGNVLGSRGSVIPTFVQQIQAGGPVTVTDARMTRFFMSIPEAVRLVLQSAAMSRGGEIFMLEMGEPVRIMDLAQRMIRLSGRRVGEDVEIRVTGSRPGEKLVEELRTPEETSAATTHPSIVQLTPVRLDPAVLQHEVSTLVDAAHNGLDETVRTSLFLIATRRARRRRPSAGAPYPDLQVLRRSVDTLPPQRETPAWTRTTT